MPVWTLALSNQLTVPPAYDATRVYFALEGDRIAAYDIVSGERQWLVTARPQMQPVAGDGLLFLVEPDALTALNAVDGSVAWQLPFAEKLAVVPVWDNGWLVLATATGEVLAFRATDGHLVWRQRLESPAHAPPALAADRVYVPTDNGRIVALQVETGERLWERRLGGAADDILALDERLYAGSTDNFFYCLMAKDGRVAWRWRTGGRRHRPADRRRRPRVFRLARQRAAGARSRKAASSSGCGRCRCGRPGDRSKAGDHDRRRRPERVAARAFDMKDGKPAGETAGRRRSGGAAARARSIRSRRRRCCCS